MNFIFISPQFPPIYWNFCDRLRKNGVNVLGIGDSPYDSLSDGLKGALTEYYRVENMEDYGQMYRAVAFFAFKYGKIDWIESNNEYWLEQDARLRTDFNVTTGVNIEDVKCFKSKWGMKEYYKKAGVPTARCHRVTTLKAAKAFIELVEYPVIVKPDNGVGAEATYKLENDADLEAFFADLPSVPYVMEEFITGDIYSYDAITDSKCEPLFESMTAWPPSIMDIVNDKLDLAYFVEAGMPAKLRKLGRATAKSFGARSRFIHLEFFKLKKAKEGLGKVGDFVGLEVNMRPAGSYTPDMMNYAHSTDVYEIWAEMVAFDERRLPESGDDHFCVTADRRDIYDYDHTNDEIFEKYGDRIVKYERLPAIWEDQMGNETFVAHADDAKAAREFIKFVTARKKSE